MKESGAKSNGEINNLENNKILTRYTIEERILWALSHTQNPILTTNFRPYEVVILHAVTTVLPDIQVVWCDTGYNTPQTYRHVLNCVENLNLNLKTYVPKNTVAFRNTYLRVPTNTVQELKQLTEEVKLEPFKRALNELKPDLWFTNIRKGQTSLRDSLDILSNSTFNIPRFSPFYDFTDQDMQEYISKYCLFDEQKYYDPTKPDDHRECGLHISNNE